MTRQFDVYATPLRRGRIERPYIVIVQSDSIDSTSRVCAPLVAKRFLTPQHRLNPAFNVEGQDVYFHPVEMITLPLRALRDAVTNLEADRDRIIAALDLVYTGI
jgi:toxin CcdB